MYRRLPVRLGAARPPPTRTPPLSPATCWLPYDRWRPFSKQAEPNGSERASERGGILSAAPSPPRHLLGKVIRCWNAKARRQWRRRRVQAPAPLDECGEQQRPLRLNHGAAVKDHSAGMAPRTPTTTTPKILWGDTGRRRAAATTTIAAFP